MPFNKLFVGSKLTAVPPPPPTGLLLIALTTSFSLFAVELVLASTADLTPFVAAVFASTAVLTVVALASTALLHY